jgi:hypothetical protein
MGEICTITWAISPLTNGQITPVVINFRPISSCDLHFGNWGVAVGPRVLMVCFTGSDVEMGEFRGAPSLIRGGLLNKMEMDMRSCPAR